MVWYLLNSSKAHAHAGLIKRFGDIDLAGKLNYANLGVYGEEAEVKCKCKSLDISISAGSKR